MRFDSTAQTTGLPYSLQYCEEKGRERVTGKVDGGKDLLPTKEPYIHIVDTATKHNVMYRRPYR